MAKLILFFVNECPKCTKLKVIINTLEKKLKSNEEILSIEYKEFDIKNDDEMKRSDLEAEFNLLKKDKISIKGVPRLFIFNKDKYGIINISDSKNFYNLDTIYNNILNKLKEIKNENYINIEKSISFDDIFKKKYIKYKNKYLKLKN
jgi:hypothetical protein